MNLEQPSVSLKRAKEILTAKGLKPLDYMHLSYNQILKLAGLKK